MVIKMKHSHTTGTQGSLRPFWLFQSGQFISRFGSKMTAYGLVLWAYSQSGSVLSATMLTVCTIAPLFLLSFLFGSLGDKWDRKTIMLAADGVAALSSVFTLVLLLTGQLRVWHLYVINLILGVSDAFQGPAVSSALSSLIPKEKYAATSGIRSFCNAAVDIAYPMAATALYTLCGLYVIVAVDLLTFVFAAGSLWLFIRIPPVPGQTGKRPGAVHLLAEGIRYLAGFKGMLYLLLYKASINFSVALTRTLLTPMVLSRGGNELQLGVISTVSGLSTLLGSLLVIRAKAPQKRVPHMAKIMILCCIPGFFVAFGRNACWWGAGQFLGMLLTPMWVAHIDVLMRTRVPVEMHSRLFAAEETLKQGGLVLGMVLSGVLTDHLLEPAVARLAGNPSAPVAWALNLLVGLTPGGGIALMFAVSSVLSILFSLWFCNRKALMDLDTRTAEEPIK